MRGILSTVILCFSLGALAAVPENITDAEITRRVQEQVMRDASLSHYLKSVRIITLNGEVLMKGQVLNQNEAESLLAKAQSVPGVIDIVNEIEIKE